MEPVTRTFDEIKRRTAPVYFDVTNPEHIKAFEMQCLGVVREDGTRTHRTHPTLRFVLESPFLDIITMLMFKVSQAYVVQFNQLESQPNRAA